MPCFEVWLPVCSLALGIKRAICMHEGYERCRLGLIFERLANGIRKFLSASKIVPKHLFEYICDKIIAEYSQDTAPCLTLAQKRFHLLLSKKRS
jgi:hypothetical protein